MTARQKKVYKFILRYLKENYMLPTVKAISIELGSKNYNSGHEHIQSLIKKGWLKKISKTSKTANYKPVFISLEVTQEKEITVIKTQKNKNGESNGTCSNCPIHTADH